MANHTLQASQAEGTIDQVILCPELHSMIAELIVIETGQHDERCARSHPLKPSYSIQPTGIGKTQVSQHQVDIYLSQQVLGLLHALRHYDLWRRVVEPG